MTNQVNTDKLNTILEALVDEISLPIPKYREAKQHYAAVSKWLEKEDSELYRYLPTIYPQGSIALGIANKPIGREEFDVDCVCLLSVASCQITQMQLMEIVGNRLKHPNSPYKDMVDPKEGGRRCWTIRYADQSKFHLDILPAIPDDRAIDVPSIPKEWTETAILISDRKTWSLPNPEWPSSNPKGYIAWFKNRMLIRLDELKREYAIKMQARTEEIEDFEVRTPLQQLIQLLKRHRDIRYNGDDDKPISILITTLAGLAYENETNLLNALLSVVPRMRSQIQKRDEVWWVENPVNPLENFADKWHEEPRKAKLFLEWLNAVEREFRQLLTVPGFAKISSYFRENYGERDSKSVIAKYGLASLAPTVIVPAKEGQPTTPRVEVGTNSSKPWGQSKSR